MQTHAAHYLVSITKHCSALYIGMAKVLPIIDVLGYDGQNSSFLHNISYLCVCTYSLEYCTGYGYVCW